MLNRIILIAASVLGATLLLAGCTKVLDPAQEPMQTIGFNAGSSLLRDENDTKTASPLSESVHMGVFAYLKNGNVGAQGAPNKPNFMFNQDLEYNSSTGIYSYNPTRFWPSSDNKLSFWAYSPYVALPNLLVTNTNKVFTNNSSSLPDISVTVDGHTDYRVTNLVKNQTFSSTNSGINGTVLLPFNHTLSLIDVKADKDDSSGHYTVTLKSVRFDGLYMSGLLRWNSSPNTWEWASQGGARENITVFTGNEDLVHNTPTLLTATPQTKLMLLPQSLSDDACRLHLEFTLSYTTHDDILNEDVQHNIETSRDVYLRDAFSGLTDVTWLMNGHYTLTITIVPNKPILFTVTWSTWGDSHTYFLSN